MVSKTETSSVELSQYQELVDQFLLALASGDIGLATNLIRTAVVIERKRSTWDTRMRIRELSGVPLFAGCKGWTLDQILYTLEHSAPRMPPGRDLSDPSYKQGRRLSSSQKYELTIRIKELRTQGLTFVDIAEIVGVSDQSCSNWLR